MLFLSILPCLFVTVVFGSQGNGGHRIINGVDSPGLGYEVYIVKQGKYCGGTIIKLDWILTAKHCVVKNWKKKDYTPVRNYARAGISDLTERATRRNIPARSIITHPSADLALLKVSPPFEKSNLIQPIPINDVHEDLQGKALLISGWGKTTEQSNPSKLQATFVKATGKTQSHSQAGTVFQTEDSKGRGVCFGDSGGPAVLANPESNNSSPILLAGVISYVSSHRGLLGKKKICGPNANNGLGDFPSSYSSWYVDVFHYSSWIKNYTDAKHDGFTYHSNTSCQRRNQKRRRYDDKSHALSQCQKSDWCTMVVDDRCDGGFYLCKGSSRTSTRGSCSWTKNIDTIAKWSSWGEWTTCSKSCGQGSQSRLRNCLPTKSNSKDCPGKSKEVEICETSKCKALASKTTWKLHLATASCFNRFKLFVQKSDIAGCAEYCNDLSRSFMIWNDEYKNCNCCGNPPEVRSFPSSSKVKISIYRVISGNP